MKDEWYNPTNPETLFSVPAIKHKITKELCVFGKRGEIWKRNDGTLSVLLKTTTGLRKIEAFFNLEHRSMSRGDEIKIDLPATAAVAVSKIIGIPHFLGRQVSIANGVVFAKRAPTAHGFKPKAKE